ncbi:MAG: thiamine phosphate synthase [Fibrobacterota bacterium]
MPDQFGLYAVLTDPRRGYEYVTRLLTEYALPFVQLRMKGVRPFEVLKTAEMMRRCTEGTTTRLIINDDPAVARDCAADGVHVGQDDLSPARVRSIVGDQMLVGFSTHNAQQVAAAQNEPLDYLGYGPVWTTATKELPDPLRGPQNAGADTAESALPVVVIGGITAERITDLARHNLYNYALSGPLCRTADPRRALEAILSAHRQAFGRGDTGVEVS